MRAIIFLNMGAPRNLDEVEIFLKNMFNDKNIITLKSTILRKFIATSITLTRTKAAQENYKLLGGQSPLVKHTQTLLDEVSKIYKDDEVVSIMRYTPPFAKDVLKDLKSKGIDEVVLFPLYPHYSTTTVKSSLEDFYDESKKIDFNPKIKEVKPYFEDALYNKALIDTIKEALKDESSSKYTLIFSAHSLPQKIIDKGDSYQDEVIKHTNILKALFQTENLEFRSYHLAYQSKLGPVKWLEPSLASKIEELKDESILIIPISFSIDNSETDFELSIEYKEEAEKLGIKEYKVAKAPNSSEGMLKFIKRQIDDK